MRAEIGFCYGAHLRSSSSWPQLPCGGGVIAIRHCTTSLRASPGSDIQRAVNMTGALNPVVTAQVESFVSGNIKSWSCDYNTPVTAGQICALIDPLPFEVIVDQDHGFLALCDGATGQGPGRSRQSGRGLCL